MFEYLLMIFGINIQNKILSQFLTGLTLTIFSVLSLRNLLLIQMKDDFGLLFTKILCFIMCFSNLLSYIWIKFKSKEILELNIQFKKQRINIFVKSSFYCSSILAITVWLLLTTISILLRLVDRRIDELFDEFFNEINLSTLAIGSDLVLAIVYSKIWKILIQYIYHDMNIQYSIIIEAFIEEMRRKINYPDINVIRMTHRTVLNFMSIQTSLKKCVKFIELFIFVDVITLILLFLAWTLNAILNSDSYCFCLCISYIIVLVSYNLWIRFETSFVKKIEKMINFYSNRWQRFPLDENCCLELKILDRSVQQLIKF
jgi:hypothetical protein